MVNLALVSRAEGFYNLALRFYWINWKLLQFLEPKSLQNIRAFTRDLVMS